MTSNNEGKLSFLFAENILNLRTDKVTLMTIGDRAEESEVCFHFQMINLSLPITSLCFFANHQFRRNIFLFTPTPFTLLILLSFELFFFLSLRKHVVSRERERRLWQEVLI